MSTTPRYHLAAVVVASMAVAVSLSPALHAAPLEEERGAARAAAPDAQGPGAQGPGDLQRLAPAQAGGVRLKLEDSDGNGLSDSLDERLGGLGPSAMIDVIVTFDGPGNAATARQSVGDFAVRRDFRLIRGFAATMTASQARALASAPGVFRVEGDAMAYASLEAARQDFGVEDLQTTPGDPSTQDPTGEFVDVCVLDTGIQADNEQFTDGVAGRVVGFRDFVGDYFGTLRVDPYDDHGHGSHVSGIIAGDGTAEPAGDSVIAPLARGVAPKARLHAAKVLDYNGSGPDSGIIAALEWCVLDQGVHVANMSLGIPGSSDGKDALSEAVNAAVDQGVAVIVAAGNAGDGEKTIGAPGAATGAITVGAVAEYTPSTIPDATSAGIYPAPFSSRGPTKDGRVKPDVAAPGVSIVSAMTNIVAVDPDPFFGGGGIIDLGCGVGCYALSSGTSMASPFVAGAVALMLDANPGLAPADVREILKETSQERGSAGQDNVFGHGLIDVAAAVRTARGELLNASNTTSFPHNVFQQASVADNGVVRIPIAVVDPSKPLAITVAIAGKSTRFGWSPDLDMNLLDEFGEPFLIENPLYDLLGGEPFIPAPGTSSTCPAGEDCGLVGTQETIHIGMPGSLQASPYFFVEVYPFGDRPNNGKGGSFTIELSNAYFAGPIDGLADDQVVADAGSDLAAATDPTTGEAEVVLDGRASRGLVAAYRWKDASGQLIAEAASASVFLPTGDYVFTLETDDASGSTTSDTVQVSVTAGSDGGGKKGGGNGNGGGKGSSGKGSKAAGSS